VDPFGKSTKSTFFIFIFYSLYDKSYTTPLTVWYQKCTTAITALKWCLLYFDEGEATLKDGDKEK
jgi:hypothetical protein